MLEILVILIGILIPLGLAKRGRGRRMGKYIKGNVDEGVVLTTLAAKTLVSALFDETPDEEVFCTSVIATWSIAEFTANAGDGPILVGLAHGDYSDAEIEQVIENTGSWSRGDLVSQEIGNRKVRIVGKFDLSNVGANVFTGPAALNDGMPVKTKLNWGIITGATLKIWAYNLGTSPLADTAPVVTANGHANLFAR